jgi:CheY-like chemotaxis protein
MRKKEVKKKVLWAEDDADDLMLVRDIIQTNRWNIEITEVRNGKEALDYLGNVAHPSELPSLIVLDINMPVMDGKQALASIKNSGSYNMIPVIVFSTSSNEMDKLFCKRYHTEMVTKPSYYQFLEQAVKGIFGYLPD